MVDWIGFILPNCPARKCIEHIDLGDCDSFTRGEVSHNRWIARCWHFWERGIRGKGGGGVRLRWCICSDSRFLSLIGLKRLGPLLGSAGIDQAYQQENNDPPCNPRKCPSFLHDPPVLSNQLLMLTWRYVITVGFLCPIHDWSLLDPRLESQLWTTILKDDCKICALSGIGKFCKTVEIRLDSSSSTWEIFKTKMHRTEIEPAVLGYMFIPNRIRGMARCDRLPIFIHVYDKPGRQKQDCNGFLIRFVQCVYQNIKKTVSWIMQIDLISC